MALTTHAPLVFEEAGHGFPADHTPFSQSAAKSAPFESPRDSEHQPESLKQLPSNLSFVPLQFLSSLLLTLSSPLPLSFLLQPAKPNASPITSIREICLIMVSIFSSGFLSGMAQRELSTQNIIPRASHFKTA